MAFNTKGITIEINGDSKKLDEELRKVKQEVQGVDHEMSKLSRAIKTDKGFSLFASQQRLTADKVGNLKKQLGTLNSALDTTKAKYKEVCEAGGEMSAEAQGLAQNISYLESEIALTESQIDQLSSTMIMGGQATQHLYHGLGRIAEGAQKAYEFLLPISTLSFAAIAGATATTVSFEDAWVGVTKTVEGTPQQLDSIDKGMRQLALSTASSYEELAGMGEIAGQMGVATDSVLGFVETMAKLGDTTNLTGEEAAAAMAKIANIMVEADQRTTDYYSRFGAAVVDLGNNFATTESDIVNMATRLATAGRGAGMNTQQILALSTALSSMGIEAAAGGGSMSKLMTNIAKNVSNTKAGSAEAREELQMFAEVAGMTADEFVQAWGEDAGNAFMKLMEGIGNSEDVLVTMNKLGIDTEIRMSNGVRALAQSTDVYADAMKRSNQAWDENTALTAEAEKRYGTVKTSLLQAKEAIRQAADALGQQFAPYLKKGAIAVRDFAKYISKLDKSTIKMVAGFLSIGTAAAPAMKGISLLAKGGQNVVKTFTGVNKIAGKLQDKLHGVAEGATPATMSLLSFAKANPVIAGVTVAVGALTAGIAALVAYQKIHTAQMVNHRRETDRVYDADMKLIEANNELVDKTSQGVERMKESVDSYAEQRLHVLNLRDSIGELIQKQNELHGSGGELSDAEKTMLGQYVNELNQILPELGLHFDETTGQITTSTGAVLDNVDALNVLIRTQLEAARNQAMAQMVAEQEANLRSLQRAYRVAELNVNKYTKEIEDNTNKQDELREQMNEMMKNGVDPLNKKYQELNKTIEELESKNKTANEALKAAKQSLEEIGQSLSETTMQYLMSINDLYTQAGSPEIMSKELAEKMQEMIKTAGEHGLKVPEAFAESFKAGAPKAGQACAYMSTFVVLDDLVSKGGIAGGQITAEMINNMLAGAGGLVEATSAMETMLDFSEMLAKSELAGQEIPRKCIDQIVQGFSEGTLTVATAMDMVKDAIANPDKWTEAGSKGGKQAVDSASAELNKGAESASASGANMGGAFAGGLDGAIKNKKIANPLANNAEWSINAFTQKGTESGTGIVTGMDTGIKPLQSKIKTAMSNASSAVKSSKIDSEASTKGKNATSRFESAFKIKSKAQAEANNAANAISGSAIASRAGGTGSSATAAFARNLNLVGETRRQYNEVKSMIRELQNLARNPIKISVEKHTTEIKTVKNGGGGGGSSSGSKIIPRAFAMPSAQAIEANEVQTAYAMRASAPAQSIADSLMASDGVFGVLNERVNRLSSRMDSFASNLNLDVIEEKLDKIANARGFVDMDGRRVGEVVWKPVQSAQTADTKIRDLMMGVK